MTPTNDSRYVVYLEDDEQDQQLVREIFPKIVAPLVEFFQENFSWNVGTGDIHLRTVADPQSLRDLLLDSDGNATSVGEQCLFFLLDLYLDDKGDLTIHTPGQIGPMSVRSWLDTLLPAVPKVILTHADPDERNIQHAAYIKKSALQNPDTLRLQLRYYFDAWWKPEFWQSLRSYATTSGGDSWHTPGHNRGEAFKRSNVLESFYDFYQMGTFHTDLSVSVDELGDLSEPCAPAGTGWDTELQPLDRARHRTSAIFGAEETFYITNGTSTSNKAMLMTLLKPGDVVLLDRNCHKSVHQAVVMSGAFPLYLSPAFNRVLNVWAPLSLGQLRSAIEREYPEAIRPRMLILTSCTYEGLLYPMWAVSQLCEQHGILLYADEAWGPYLRFHPFYSLLQSDGHLLPYHAIGAGADFVVQSTHKALAAFSQASMIHISHRFAERMEQKQYAWLRDRFVSAYTSPFQRFRHELLETLRYWHSTSPHYPMLATLDCAGIQMRLEGAGILGRLLRESLKRRKKWDELTAEGGGCLIGAREIVGGDSPDYQDFVQDPLKLVLGFRGNTADERKRNGDRFRHALRGGRVRYEKSSDGCVEFLATIGTHEDHFARLEGIVAAHSRLLGRNDPTVGDLDYNVATGRVAVLPRTAALSAGELLPLQESVERICAQMVVPYPPGIPVFLPGFRITPEMLTMVQDAAMEDPHAVHGLLEIDGSLYVKVMTTAEEDQAMRQCGDTIDSFERLSTENVQ